MPGPKATSLYLSFRTGVLPGGICFLALNLVSIARLRAYPPPRKPCHAGAQSNSLSLSFRTGALPGGICFLALDLASIARLRMPILHQESFVMPGHQATIDTWRIEMLQWMHALGSR